MEHQRITKFPNKRCHNQNQWVKGKITRKYLAIVFASFLPLVLASSTGSTTVSDKCTYLSKSHDQDNAYVASHGEMCCMCWKGTYLADDCKVGYPSTTSCRACERTTTKLYIDYEPHMERRCMEDKGNCIKPMIPKGGTASSRSRCECPNGMVKFGYLFCLLATVSSALTLPTNTSYIYNITTLKYGATQSKSIVLSEVSQESDFDDLKVRTWAYILMTLGIVVAAYIVACTGILTKRMRRIFKGFKWNRKVKSKSCQSEINVGFLQPESTNSVSSIPRGSENWTELPSLSNKASPIHPGCSNPQAPVQCLVNTTSPSWNGNRLDGVSRGHSLRESHRCSDITAVHDRRREAAFSNISRIISLKDATTLASRLLSGRSCFDTICEQYRLNSELLAYHSLKRKVQLSPMFCLHLLLEEVEDWGYLKKLVVEELQRMAYEQ